MSIAPKIRPSDDVLFEAQGTWQGKSIGKPGNWFSLKNPANLVEIVRVSAYGYELENSHNIQQLPPHLQKMMAHVLYDVLEKAGFGKQKKEFHIVLTEKQLQILGDDKEKEKRFSSAILAGKHIKGKYYKILSASRKIAQYARLITQRNRPSLWQATENPLKAELATEELQKLHEMRSVYPLFSTFNEKVRDWDNVSGLGRMLVVLFTQTLLPFVLGAAFGIIKGLVNPFYRIKNIRHLSCKMQEATIYHDKQGIIWSGLNLFDQFNCLITNELLLAWKISEVVGKYALGSAKAIGLKIEHFLNIALNGVFWNVMSIIALLLGWRQYKHTQKFSDNFNQILKIENEDERITTMIKFLKGKVVLTKAEKEHLLIKAKAKHHYRDAQKIQKTFEKMCARKIAKKKIKLERSIGEKAAKKVMDYFTQDVSLVSEKSLINDVQKGLKAQRLSAYVFMSLGALMTVIGILGFLGVQVLSGPLGTAFWIGIALFFIYADRGGLEQISNWWHKKHKHFKENNPVI